MKKTKYVIAFLIVMSLNACKKQESMYYEGDNRVSFVLDQYEIDSLNYSFAFDLVPKERDTVFLKMRVQGPAEDRERVVNILSGKGTTAILNEDYILPSFIVPAGALTFNYPLILINSKRMVEEAVKIKLEVGESVDFLPGGIGQEIGGTKAVNSYKVWVSNKLDKPAYWDDISYYFGVYSAKKLQFMISTIGITDFSYENIGAFGIYNYPVTLRNALAKYEEVNGPMIDEFDNQVTF